MGEGAAAIALAECPDAGNAGREEVVDLNVAAGIRRHAGLIKSEIIGIRPPPYGNQQVRAAYVRRLLAGTNADADAVPVLLYFDRLAVQVEPDALLLQKVGNRA